MVDKDEAAYYGDDGQPLFDYEPARNDDVIHGNGGVSLLIRIALMTSRAPLDDKRQQMG